MSTTETHAEPRLCEHGPAHAPDAVEAYPPKDVPLGGEDALRVRRTLPNLRRSFVGAWCFIDHYGPEEGACMDVPPHPHTSLQDGVVAVQRRDRAPRLGWRPSDGAPR